MRPSGEFHLLLEKYLNNSATAAEKERFMEMAGSDIYAGEMEKTVDGMLETPVEADEDILLREEIFERLQRVPSTRSITRSWKRYAAAAAVMGILATGSYYLLRSDKTGNTMATVPARQTIQPGTVTATLQLDDGSIIKLDSAGQQTIQQGSTTIRQQGGQIVYEAVADAVAVRYNTLKTPRGGLFQLELPDGSKVWLNAASAIRYPVAFSPQERRVEITGEAYFEVNAANAPFVVVCPHQEVTVLGTHFNINAYEEEGMTSTTLLQGKVMVTCTDKAAKSAAVVLSPAQEAVIVHNNPTGNIAVRTTSTEAAASWKNGYFVFDQEQLSGILRMLVRWYNVEIDAAPSVLSLKFSAVIARSADIEDVLSLLSETGAFRFSRTGNKLKVY